MSYIINFNSTIHLIQPIINYYRSTAHYNKHFLAPVPHGAAISPKLRSYNRPTTEANIARVTPASGENRLLPVPTNISRSATKVI